MPLQIKLLSVLVLVTIGLISLLRPQWMGVTLRLVKGKRGLGLTIRYSQNPYYLHQIKVVGIGTLLASLVVMIL